MKNHSGSGYMDNMGEGDCMENYVQIFFSTLYIDAQFICYSSNECRGNALLGIGVVEDCCVAGGGLSYRTISGQCTNCYGRSLHHAESVFILFSSRVHFNDQVHVYT